MNLSSRTFYTDYRRNYPLQVIRSFCRQVISLADAEEREETARLQIEQKNLLAKQREQKESEPWEDAPGVIVNEISYPDGTKRQYAPGDCPED